MQLQENIIKHTQKWINDVVICCNFCPFAAKEFKNNTIQYEVVFENEKSKIISTFLNLLNKLKKDKETETAFIILPNGYISFHKYLQLVKNLEKRLSQNNYSGIFQIASFHPNYLFANSNDNDPANYTNRSPYPMLHILREKSISKAKIGFENINNIPLNNTKFANTKGLDYMKNLKENTIN